VVDELACSATGRLGARQIILPRQAPGTYFVWVDGLDDTSGAFQLQVSAAPATAPPANDTCAGAAPLSLPLDGGAVRLVADTAYATNDFQTRCQTTDELGRDVVYHFNLPDTAHVIAFADAGAGPTAPVLYLRQGDCSDAGAELEAMTTVFGIELCERIGSLNVLDVTLDAGEYYLFVDAQSAATSGPTSVQLRRAP
jgi:hypothetical protein